MVNIHKCNNIIIHVLNYCKNIKYQIISAVLTLPGTNKLQIHLFIVCNNLNDNILFYLIFFYR